MKKLAIFSMVCVMSVSLLTSCGKPNLEGKWSLCNSDGNELDITLRFKDDGTVKIDDEKEDYKVVDKDTIEIADEEYDFKIIDEDDKLIYLGEFSDNIEIEGMNKSATTLCKAINSALSDIDEEDKYYSSSAVICSDSSKSINAIPENASDDFDLSTYIKPFYSDIENYEYIALIEDGGWCSKVAVREPSGKIVGTYPEDEFKDMTFDEIYNEMKNSVQ